VRLGRFLELGGGLGRIEDSLGKDALTFDRETDDFGILDRSLCDLLRRGDDEVADTAPLNLSGPSARQ